MEPRKFLVLFAIFMLGMGIGVPSTTFAQSDPITEKAPEKPELDDHQLAELNWAERRAPEDTGGPDLFGYTLIL